jgi:hypothetical protein
MEPIYQNVAEQVGVLGMVVKTIADRRETSTWVRFGIQIGIPIISAFFTGYVGVKLSIAEMAGEIRAVAHISATIQQRIERWDSSERLLIQQIAEMKARLEASDAAILRLQAHDDAGR